MTIKAIIFDVDGTLADTEDAHRRAFNMAFAESGFNWKWDVELYGRLLKITGGKERIHFFISTALPNFSKPADYDGFIKNLHQLKTAHYTAMLRNGDIPLRPNVKRLITEMKQAGVRLAIATTTSPENVTALLQHGLGKPSETLFDAIGCGDIVPQKKPAPDIYHWVLQSLNLQPDECIALEDSENGLQSSLAAGVKTFITTNDYTRNQNFAGAAAVLDDLSDLEHFYKVAGLDNSAAGRPLSKTPISV